MNRCTSPSSLAVSACLAALLWASVASSLIGSASAQAQTDESADTAKLHIRQFPKGVHRGEMVVLNGRTISMDGKPDELSVGSRIRDTNNMLVFATRLLNQKVVVNYLRENTGRVHQVWILNSEEAKVKLPGGSGTSFNFSTDGNPARPDVKKITPYNQLPAYNP